MSVKSDNYQIGVSVTAANNFVFSTDGAGSLILQRGITTGGTVVPTQELLRFDASGNMTGQSLAPLRNDYFRFISTGAAILERDSINGGKHICINGVNQVIPAAGVSVSAGTLPINTLHYSYAYMNSGAIAVEHSTTVPVFDTNTGVMVKTGDASRTCVGMHYPTVANQFNLTYFISFANRRIRQATGAYAAPRNWAGTTPTELDAAGRSNFLHWGDEIVNIGVVGVAYNNTAGSWTTVQTSLNGTGGRSAAQVQAVANYNANLSFPDSLGPSRGVNSLTLLCSVANGGTGTWNMQTFVTYRG